MDFPDGHRASRHVSHLYLAVPPRLALHSTFRFPSTPLPTPSKTRLPTDVDTGTSLYAAVLLRLLALHSLFLLALAARALPSLPHLLLLPPLLTILSATAVIVIPTASKSQPYPFPALHHLLRPALLLALSLLLRLASLHLNASS